MQINTIQLENKSNLINDYRNGKSSIIDFFDYKPFDSYETRINDLKDRTFNRSGLVQVLKEMNKAWSAPEETLKQIDLLLDEESVVVIGGQQAGLLTGPMYTVNKIISIIKLAREQSAKLNVPVIPVFWIAGEDHDYAEINHTYTNNAGQLKKHIINQQVYLKYPVSEIEIDKGAATKWIEKIFSDLLETDYTKDIYTVVEACLEKSATYVDFCARLIFELFPDEGIVLIDSGSEQVRALEADMFKQLIDNQAKISDAVYETIEKLQHKGYQIPLDVTKLDTHLFFHDNNNERILLERKDEMWIGKNEEVTLTTAELLEIAKNTPEQLSNNVVTRPIVQEMLFPTLAFVAGDGEISYWASLQKAFSTLGLKVPPVLPRLSFTFVSTRINKLLKKRVVDIDFVINNNVNTLKLNWLMSQPKAPIQHMFIEAERALEQLYGPLQNVAAEEGANLEQVAAKNLAHMQQHLVFLENQLINNEKRKHALYLSQFDEIENYIKPNQGLQERIWNPLPFVNEVGISFIKQLIESDCSFENDHYLVYF